MSQESFTDYDTYPVERLFIIMLRQLYNLIDSEVTWQQTSISVQNIVEDLQGNSNKYAGLHFSLFEKHNKM